MLSVGSVTPQISLDLWQGTWGFYSPLGQSLVKSCPGGGSLQVLPLMSNMVLLAMLVLQRRTTVLDVGSDSPSNMRRGHKNRKGAKAV